MAPGTTRATIASRRMRLRDARVLTALAVIGLCGFAVSRGWNIAHFSIATAGVASPQHRADAVRPWIGVTGLAGAALEASLTDAVDPTDSDGIRKRRDVFAAILSVRPMSSMNWFSLAIMRLMVRQPTDKIIVTLVR